MIMRARKPLSLAIAACFTAGAGSAFGQALEEIVVTAQKREQSLQEAPISIAAFGEHELEQQGVKDLTDLGSAVPNVKITPSPGNSSAATIAIRGSVTTNPAIQWEPTVGIYMDGVFIAKNVGGVFDVAELQRVEILRGPQGTLYGKNTVGGAVNLITKKPSGQFGGEARVGGGNYDLVTGYLSVDTPSWDLGGAGQVMAKFTGSYRKRDGFYENKPDPYGIPLAQAPKVDDLNSLDNTAWRSDILWDATERLSVRWTYDDSEMDLHGTKAQLTWLDPADPYGINALLEPYLVPETENAETVHLDQANFEHSGSKSHSLFVDYDLGEVGVLGDVTLRYIGNDRDLEWDDFIDIDGSPIDFFHSHRGIAYEQTSHEVQLVGATDRTDYVVGLYYLEEEADVYNPISFFNVFGAPTSHNRYGFLTESVAAFGQVEWRPGWAWADERLALTFGARWTEEEKDVWVNHPPRFPGDPSAYEARDEQTFDNFSPSFVASWEVNERINTYFKLVKGWKSGGINAEAATKATFDVPYESAEIRSTELGFKSRWLDSRLQLNGAMFHDVTTDMQMSIFLGDASASSIIDNAGEATVNGVELELVALLHPSLQLTATYGYLDGGYDEFIINGVDVKDQKDFAWAPENSATVSAEWTVAQGGWGDLTARLDWQYVDDHVPYIEPHQNETLQIEAYDILNGRITLANLPIGDSTAKVALWGKNLTDDEYRIHGIPFGLWSTTYFGDPRTYGLEATLDF
ncbi:TonB-dependent receptor [Proteobacteria bacterium 005FR1]|nr:TonB-dependent receptor [Proteobacteria bacterium 005FR1]